MSATKETLQEMMVLYGHDVWNLAYSLTRKADLADDISQDVFLKAYQKIESLRTQTSVKSWLLRITRNTALDYKRSFFFKRVTLYGSFFDNEPAHPSAEKEAYDNILQCLAWNVVLKLPVKYREVLVLFGHYDLSIQEIAEIVGVGESTVKTRLYRAWKKAWKLFKEREADERTGS